MVKKIDPQVIDYLLEQMKSPQEIFGGKGVFKELKKALLERALEGELTSSLGYEKHQSKGSQANTRNGYSQKTIQTEEEELEVKIPRDRDNKYEPLLIPKHQRRFADLDKKIISLYARGMSTRDIQDQLFDLYGTEISATMISNVTNEVIDEVKAWQSRPLDKLYAIVYLDALVIKVQQDKRVINKSFYLALGVDMEGKKELLGIWISQNEGSKFWLNVLTELKNRGVEDILIACVDGLKGFPEAIKTVYPETKVQICIVHMIRNSLRYVSWKQKKEVAQDLKAIYTANTEDEAELALTAFSEKWDSHFPSISRSWLNHWENITPFFEYPKEIRKTIYTTNAIESLNMSIRKVIKNKRVFPSDEAALKQLYLGLKNIAKKWTMPIKDWAAAINRFVIMFGDRVTRHIEK